MHISRHRPLFAACVVAALGLALAGRTLSQEQVSKERASVQAEAAKAGNTGINLKAQTPESDAVVFPKLRDRLLIMAGAVVLFGGLAVLVDALRRRADARAGMDRINAI